MTRWQYKWVRPAELSPPIMDSLGCKGWEFAGQLGGDWVIFKRPWPYDKVEDLQCLAPGFSEGDVRRIVCDELDRFSMG